MEKDFERLQIAIANLFMAICEAMKIPQIVEWLNRKLS